LVAASGTTTATAIPGTLPTAATILSALGRPVIVITGISWTPATRAVVVVRHCGEGGDTYRVKRQQAPDTTRGETPRRKHSVGDSTRRPATTANRAASDTNEKKKKGTGRYLGRQQYHTADPPPRDRSGDGTEEEKTNAVTHEDRKTTTSTRPTGHLACNRNAHA